MAKEKSDTESDAATSTGAKRILVVDDDYEIIDAMRAALEAKGYEVACVNVERLGHAALAVAVDRCAVAEADEAQHAIAGLTRSLAMELAPQQIRVNAVCPGAAMTEGAIALVTAGAPEGIDVEAQWDGIKDRTPLGRLCDPDDVARAALFLVSDMAEFVTGAFLVVDGGILIQPLEGYVPSSE